MARDVNEAGAGKQFRQHLDTSCVRRRLQQHAFPRVHGQAANEELQFPFELRDIARGGVPHVEEFHVRGRILGIRHSQVRRGRAERQQGELVFLGTVPPRLHVVHRPILRQQKRRAPGQEPIAHQKMARCAALVRRGRTELAVEEHQFVEQCRAAAPVANDEHGRLRNPRGGDSPSEDGPLNECQQRVHRGDQGDHDRHRQPQWMRFEPVASPQPYPVAKPHPVPKSRAPERIGMNGFRRRLLVGGGFGRVWRNVHRNPTRGRRCQTANSTLDCLPGKLVAGK
ncbi:MAG: hypothetical protein RLY70_1870 [Planctomycetota bacterium]